MKSEEDTNRAMDQYANMIRRICRYHLKNAADTEDVFQNVFLKYLLYEGSFDSEEHEKAWFIRVAINACKDHLKILFRHATISMEESALAEVTCTEPEHKEVLREVLALPARYKDVIYLFYFEEYSAKEIGEILHKNENTIYSLLSRGRGILREKLGGDAFYE
ncbi:MAG: RNA polymerase sigma factor [Lachnospiraceae bacterium]|nr:RNA polymerase sigma factor [Lachnospiraceae bacterium]